MNSEHNEEIEVLKYKIYLLRKEIKEKDKEIQRLKEQVDISEHNYMEAKLHCEAGGYNPLDRIVSELDMPEICEDYYCNGCKYFIEGDLEKPHFCSKFSIEVDEDDFCSWFENKGE